MPSIIIDNAEGPRISLSLFGVGIVFRIMNRTWPMLSVVTPAHFRSVWPFNREIDYDEEAVWEVLGQLRDEIEDEENQSPL
jgi:hypothetical protein